jgi:hypothetical protein
MATKTLKKSIQLTQIGMNAETAAYRVERTTNFLEQSCGVTLTRSAVQKLIDKGITVNVSRNK